MLTNLQAATIEHFGPGQDSQAKARRISAKLFDRLYAQALRGQLWARLSGRDTRLPSLQHRPKAARRAAGVKLAPLSKIVGTEGRSADFDTAWRPLNPATRERWASVAAARRVGIALPAVELVQDGDRYFVRDGHHRIAVARAMGQTEIEARVVNG